MHKVKVAIVGAGIAGLSCAIELEKKGVIPVIYEKNSFGGEPFPHVTAVLKISHRPIRDSVKYFKDRLGISLTPLETINS
ncbi:MAG: FAD dependent oxidoreductase, partial [Pelotomaculum thermopropionicum]